MPGNLYKPSKKIGDSKEEKSAENQRGSEQQEIMMERREGGARAAKTTRELHPELDASFNRMTLLGRRKLVTDSDAKTLAPTAHDTDSTKKLPQNKNN